MSADAGVRLRSLQFSNLHLYWIILAIFCFVFSAPSTAAATWFVATNGVDTNPGTSDAPFATIMQAQAAASSGDTVYLRGGTYYLDNSNFTTTNNPWAIVNNMTKSGISYIAYPGGAAGV